MGNEWLDLAGELLAEYGRATSMTFTRAQYGEQDTDTLSRAVLTPLTYTCLGAPIDFNVREINNNTITTGQKMLYVSGVDTADVAINPQINDTVSLDVVYRVLEVTSYETKSVNCAFLLKIGI